MKKICHYCGKPFEADLARRKFCGMQCNVANRTMSPKTAGHMFWPRVAKGDGCWRWQGQHDASGYGRLCKSGPYTYVHRVAWLLEMGEIPAGMDVLHRCDVRDCCNPEHLFLGTHEDNMRDMLAKGRNPRGEQTKKNRLTVAAVLEIRRDYRAMRIPGTRAKTNAMELARKYGVARNTIVNAALGLFWKHVERQSSGDSHT